MEVESSNPKICAGLGSSMAATHRYPLHAHDHQSFLYISSHCMVHAGVEADANQLLKWATVCPRLTWHQHAQLTLAACLTM
jgi:hypothetical protein